VEKTSLVVEYRSQGLAFKYCLSITGLSRGQFYYKEKGAKPGKAESTTTKRKEPKTQVISEVSNEVVVEQISKIKQDPDQPDYYKLICVALCLDGYYINHKKVYRLMRQHLLLEKKIRQTGKTYVKHRRVVPVKPLEIIEMDIKYIWISDTRKYAFVLTIIDTFTRSVLCYSVGYSMRTQQVRQAWEFIIATYFQGVLKPDCTLQVEVRNDNGKQFSSEEITTFFADNYLMQVFTHPYTPEENGHIESFHKTLGKALKNDKFGTLQDAEKRLDTFYENYNNHRTHSATKVPPSIFWALYESGLIEVKVCEKERKASYELKVAYQDIAKQNGIKKYQHWAIRA
jgi:putative transposase